MVLSDNTKWCKNAIDRKLKAIQLQASRFSRKPKAKSQKRKTKYSYKLQASRCKPKAQSKKPKAKQIQPQAASFTLQAKSPKPKANTESLHAVRSKCNNQGVRKIPKSGGRKRIFKKCKKCSVVNGQWSMVNRLAEFEPHNQSQATRNLLPIYSPKPWRRRIADLVSSPGIELSKPVPIYLDLPFHVSLLCPRAAGKAFGDARPKL